MTSLVQLDETLEPVDQSKKKAPTGFATRRGRRTSKITYAEVFHLSVTSDEVVLFAPENHKVYGTIGINPYAMTFVKRLIDTGAGPNLVTRFFLYPMWMSRIRRQPIFKMKNANQQPIRSGKHLCYT